VYHHSMNILGLDVSTSVVGVSVVNEKAPDDLGTNVLLLDRVEFKGKDGESLWTKADAVRRELSKWVSHIGDFSVDRVIVEEPLMGFRTGMSSAQTITTLMKFNGIVSFIARELTGLDPEYVSSARARKACGVKLQKTSVAGPQKEQVFSHMMAHDLSYMSWVKKKNGADVDWSRDACDAYVIARSGIVLGQHLQVPKAKKKK